MMISESEISVRVGGLIVNRSKRSAFRTEIPDPGGIRPPGVSAPRAHDLYSRHFTDSCAGRSPTGPHRTP